MKAFARGQGDGNFRRPFVSRINLPMRLYTENGRPITDRDGVLLLNIAGKPLGKVDVHGFIFLDQRGRPLTDAANRKPNDIDFDPSTKPQYSSSELDLRCCSEVLFDVTGYPLTDLQGRPLVNRDGTCQLVFGPRGEPTSDVFGGPLLDKMGRDIMKDERPLTDTHGRPLHVYDQLRRPLTDLSGYPLVEISGVKLLVLDTNGIPCKIITGGEICDARGLMKYHSDFDLSREGPPKCKEQIKTYSGKIAVAFDKNGHPLTDMNGFPLRFATGEPMISYKHGWLDWRGERATLIRRDVFIRYTLKGFKNKSGVPIRLFDRKGRPLTDFHGAPQNHASGLVLLKFDEEGDPISDWMGRPVFDGQGYTEDNEFFRPCRTIKSQETLQKLFSLAKKPVQYFDKFGLPLTNRFGIPLVSSRDEVMVRIDSSGKALHDAEGGPVFDILGLPIVLNVDDPLLGPQNLPIRLYNSSGRPLTDNSGKILKNIKGVHLVAIGDNGQVESEQRGGMLYDRKMRPMTFGTEFNAAQTSFVEEKIDLVAKIDGEPLHLFNRAGYPLTDSNGMVLFDCRGRALIKCPDQGFITTADDESVYDVNGSKCLRTINEITKKSRAVYDKNSRPLIDQRGNILQNRRGKDLLIYKQGRPHEVLYGGRCYDSRNFPLDDPRADISIVPTWETHIIGNGTQLYDCCDLPLTDTFGVVLYTSAGIPLIQVDSQGKAKSDHAGRPVFDKRGIPITRTSGYWKDQKGKSLRLYDQDGLPLTDINGKELRDIGFRSLIRQDELGRPAFDVNNSLVNDVKGRCLTSSDFNPTYSPPIKVITLSEKGGGGLKLFDMDGRPLTDESGTILVTSKGRPLLETKKGLNQLVDIYGRRVYDCFWRPLGCTKDKQMLTIFDRPLLIYNKNGEPLTDDYGVTLIVNGNLPTIIFDEYGRPDLASNGSALFDASGNELKSYKAFFEPRIHMSDASLESIAGHSRQLFDDQGKPLTDECGTLISYQGYPVSSKFCYINATADKNQSGKSPNKSKCRQ
ncbi:uncharacterized protein LOC112127124 [Cimex lectularius]|uniref:Uncharacterized protein n=1 Tax=Cimex lectularius TaxID=79782 RepID=A0A8I6SIU3_CIMLE|nr:uncharacterized protein LOC112127124 [Cimex lectularius]